MARCRPTGPFSEKRSHIYWRRMYTVFRSSREPMHRRRRTRGLHRPRRKNRTKNMETQGTESALTREVDRHFDLPRIRRVPPGRAFAWLALGVRDLRNNLVESLAYGTLVAVLGWLIWYHAGNRPQ